MKYYWDLVRYYMPSKPVFILARLFSLTTSFQMSGGKHCTKGAGQGRLRQTSPRTACWRDLEQVANATADAFVLSVTRFAAMAVTISSNDQHLCAI